MSTIPVYISIVYISIPKYEKKNHNPKYLWSQAFLMRDIQPVVPWWGAYRCQGVVVSWNTYCELAEVETFGV